MIPAVSEFDQVVQLLRDEPIALLSVDILRDVSIPQLTITLCAFANMPDGGSVIVLADSLPASEQATQVIDRLAAEEIEPAVTLHCRLRASEGHDALVITIPGGQRPVTTVHRVRSTGIPYRRSTAGNVAMSRTDLLESTRVGRFGDDARSVPGATREHLEQRKTERFLAVARDSVPAWSRLSDTEVLQRKGVLTPDGSQLTLAGCYVLGAYPQTFFPRLRIAANRTAGKQSRLEYFEGGLPEQIEQAVRWVVRHARGDRARALDGKGYRGSEIPISAIRELITNAALHRDLSDDGLHQEIRLELVDGHLTITSPGGMPGLHPLELGTSQPAVPVNPAVYEISRLTSTTARHRVVTPMALEDAHVALLKVGMYPPRTVDTGVSTVVSVGRRIKFSTAQRDWVKTVAPHHTLTLAQQTLLLLLRDTGPEWVTGLAKRSTTLRDLLTSLHELGLVHLPDPVQRCYALAVPAQLAQPQSEPAVVPDPTVARQSADAPVDPDTRAAATSKHGTKLWAALGEGAQNIHDIAELSGLNLAKTRYAMQRLVAAGLVERTGGQGHRETIYTRA